MTDSRTERTGADPLPSARRLPHVLRALEYRNFRLFFAGQSISLVGTWLQQVAMSWLVYRLTGSEVLLGVIGFSTQIPVLLISPLAGAWADRWNRHRIMLATQMTAMIQALVISALVFSEVIAVWQLIPLSLLLGCVTAFDIPARQSFFVSIIGRREDLGNAIALNSSIVNGSRLIGPALAGVLIAEVGEGMCFLLNGLSYLAVIASLLAMTRVPAPNREGGHPRVWTSIREGLDWTFGFAPARALILLIATVSLLGFPYAVLMPAIAVEQLGGGPKLMGLLMGSAGLGAFGGAVYLATRRSVVGLGRIVGAAALLFGAALIGLSFCRAPGAAMAMLVLAGLGMIAMLTGCNTILQTLVEDRLRGRVMSVFTIAFIGMGPLGSLWAGGVAENLGVATVVRVGGLASLTAGLVFISRLPALRPKAWAIYRERGVMPKLEPDFVAAAGDPKERA